MCGPGSGADPAGQVFCAEKARCHEPRHAPRADNSYAKADTHRRHVSAGSYAGANGHACDCADAHIYVDGYTCGHVDCCVPTGASTYLDAYPYTYLDGYTSTYLDGYPYTYPDGYASTYLHGYASTHSNA